MLYLTLVGTKPAISLPSLKTLSTVQLPQQAVFGAIISGLALVLFIILLIYVIKKPSKKLEEKPLSPEELQIKHIKELKDALVKELRGTSKQNTVMIILTIIFILVTIFGSSIFILFKKISIRMKIK